VNLTPEAKARIDAMSYAQLLERWRFAPAGDTLFRGETGEYWGKRMAELRARPGGQGEHVAASKRLGWGAR
jgi:hypothetical protein